MCPSKDQKRETQKIELHDNQIGLTKFYQFNHFVNKYHLNRGFINKSFVPFRIISQLFGNLLLAQNSKLHAQLVRSYRKLFPSQFIRKQEKMHGKSFLNRWARRLSSYIIEFFMELTFFVGQHRIWNYEKFVPMDNYAVIQDELSKEKGIIAPTLHLGEFLHILSSTIRRTYTVNNVKKRILVNIISSPENIYLGKEMLKPYHNLELFETGPSEVLYPKLSQSLSENRLVIIMHDYSSFSQLRIPFTYTSFNTNSHLNFLFPCPQMIPKLYFNHDAPIIPIIGVPNVKKGLKYTNLTVLPKIDLKNMDPQSENDPILREEIIRFQKGEMSKKERLGILSVLLNREMNPYILKYPFLWEEIFGFEKRGQFRIYIKKPADKFNSLSIKEFGILVLSRLKDLIDNSYEPKRKETFIIESLNILIHDISSLYDSKPDNFEDISISSIQKISDSDSNLIQSKKKGLYYDIGFRSGKKSMAITRDFLMNIFAPYPEILTIVEGQFSSIIIEGFI